MTLWSEIVNTPLGKINRSYFGVEYNEGTFLAPSGVNTMTFKYKPSSDNLALDVDVLDAIIAIGKSNRMCRSTLEVNYDETEIEWDRLMELATYGEFSVAIMPPVENAPEEEYQKYKEQVTALAKAYFPLKNFGGVALPLTAIIRYMLKSKMSEKAPLDNLIDGEMMVDVEMFEHIYGQMSLSKPINRKLVADITPVVYECFGGEADFEAFAVDFKQNIISQQQRDIAIQEGQKRFNQALEVAQREEYNLNQIANGQ